MDQKSIYYCCNCEYKIPNEQEYKAHYKSEFHRYNIKRKILGLTAVNFDAFQQKLLESKSNTSCSSSKDQTYRCIACNKTFYSNGTYGQHINSFKHKEALKQHQRNIMKGDIQSSSSETSFIRVKSNKFEQQQCLFCEQTLTTLEENIAHMEIIHGFFIREPDSLIDLDGLLEHLNRIISIDMTCLQCNKIFKDVVSTKQHMIDKGHCFMPHTEFQELSIYYDHSDKLKELIMINEQNENEEDDFQDVDEIIDSDDGDGGFVKLDLTPEQKARKIELNRLLKLINNQKAILLNTGEMQLPNGKIIGCRALRQHYKQKRVYLAKQLMLENKKQEIITIDISQN